MSEVQIAPSDTKRDRRNTIKKMSKQINAANGLIPKTMPNDVATPFPPLKSAKIGKTCPNTAEKEVMS